MVLPEKGTDEGKGTDPVEPGLEPGEPASASRSIGAQVPATTVATGWGTFPITAPVPVVSDRTGVVRAVGSGRPVPSRAVAEPPLALRALVALLSVLVVIGAAYLAVDHFRPQWLARLHLPHGSVTGTTAAAGTSQPQVTTAPKVKTAPKVTTATARTGGTAGRHSSHSSTPSTVPAFRVVSVGSGAATFDVQAAKYAVTVSSVGGESWVEATAPGQASPLYAGIMQAGQSQTFQASGTITVQIGSVVSHLSISVGKKVVGTYVPTIAPLTMTFNGAS